MTAPLRPRLGIQLEDFDNPGAVEDRAEVVEELGIELSFAHIDWGVIESEPGVYDWSRLEWWDRLRDRLGDRFPALAWTIYPVHMNERGALPPDLRSEPLDSPRMLERFEAYAAAAARRCGWGSTDIAVVNNEVNMFVDGHPDELEPMLRLSHFAVEAIHRHAPATRVCHVVTHDCLAKPGGAELFRALNANTDLVAFNWYDMIGFSVGNALRPMAEKIESFRSLVPGRPIFIPEIGLPSAAECDSDEELQARRIAEMFDYAARTDRSQFEGTVWLCLDDWPEDVLRDWAKHQFPSLAEETQFIKFLVSMGIRGRDRRLKPAYDVWREKAREREVIATPR